MTSDEKFRALVAHPYGMAAMELAFQGQVINFFADWRSFDKTQRSALLRAGSLALRLRDEVATARALARGRA